LARPVILDRSLVAFGAISAREKTRQQEQDQKSAEDVDVELAAADGAPLGGAAFLGGTATQRPPEFFDALQQGHPSA
jgi:hypothetical protein